MELMPPPDFFDSYDFDFMTAEFLQTREHDVEQKQLNEPTYDDSESPKITIMELEDDDTPVVEQESKAE